MGQKPMLFRTKTTNYQPLIIMEIEGYEIQVLCPHSRTDFLEADLFKCYYVNIDYVT